MINYPTEFTFFIEKGLIYSELLQVQANKEPEQCSVNTPEVLGCLREFEVVSVHKLCQGAVSNKINSVILSI